MILQDGMFLYNASYVPVKDIDLSLCADGKDFGKGFYVTTDYNQACRFVRTSIKKALKNGARVSRQNVGYISIYNFAQDQNLGVFELHNADAEWLHCAAIHRKKTLFSHLPYSWEMYDIIAGRIANDTTNQVLTAYINGLYGEVGSDLADETGIRLLLPNKLSDQTCFRTEKSLESLAFSQAKEVCLDEG